MLYSVAPAAVPVELVVDGRELKESYGKITVFRQSTSWEELLLHTWISVTILYGEARPKRSKVGGLRDAAGR